MRENFQTILQKLHLGFFKIVIIVSFTQIYDIIKLFKSYLDLLILPEEVRSYLQPENQIVNNLIDEPLPFQNDNDLMSIEHFPQPLNVDYDAGLVLGNNLNI